MCIGDPTVSGPRRLFKKTVSLHPKFNDEMHSQRVESCWRCSLAMRLASPVGIHALLKREMTLKLTMMLLGRVAVCGSSELTQSWSRDVGIYPISVGEFWFNRCFAVLRAGPLEATVG